MSSKKGQESFDSSSIPLFPNKKIAIVFTEWNAEVTSKLYEGAKKALQLAEVKDIITKKVPGAFELPYVCQKLAQRTEIEGIVALGAIIQGDTKHFDFISQAVSKGIMDVSLKYNKPIGFGVITPNNFQQALDRAGGKLGNKGFEAALSLLKILEV